MTLRHLDGARLSLCCPLCTAHVHVLPVARHSSQRVLLATHHTTAPAAHVAVNQCTASGADERWPHRPELKVTAAEKLTSAPDPNFPATFPLQFVEEHTGLTVRSVFAEDFAAQWRKQFHDILEAKSASAQHDEFWATGASNGRALQWRLLEIPPHSAYPLHIHPGIEVYLVVRGVLVRIKRGSKSLLAFSDTP